MRDNAAFRQLCPRRRWMGHRNTYAPRLWPTMLAVAALMVGLDVALASAAWWLRPVGGLVIGLASGFGRVEVWKRRHPVVSIEQRIEALRRSAPYN